MKVLGNFHETGEKHERISGYNANPCNIIVNSIFLNEGIPSNPVCLWLMCHKYAC